MFFSKLFNKRDSLGVGVSVPIPDESEATWQGEEILSIDSPSSSWAEPEGELALDVYFTDDSVVVRTTVAGVKPEDIKVSIHNDLLTLRGRRQEEAIESGRQYVVQECHWGSFSRSVVLPVIVDPDSAEAVIKNGVLTVTLKRTEPTTVKVREEDV